MACTVKSLQQWLATIPADVEVGVDEGGLTLVVVDDPTISHEPRCIRHQLSTAACTCWKTAQYEIGGVPE